MGNPPTLAPRFTSESGREAGKKGGQASNPRKAFAAQLYCNEKCHYKSKCSAISLSQTIRKVKGKRPCFYKTCTKEVQESVQNLFENGEQGIMDEILKELNTLIYNHKIDHYDSFKIIETLINVKKGIYGDKQKIEHSGSIVQFIDDIPRKPKDGNTKDTIF